MACRPRPCRLSPRLPGRSRSRNREGRPGTGGIANALGHQDPNPLLGVHVPRRALSTVSSVPSERWALLVARKLLPGPERFPDPRAGLPHASPNVLGQRLRQLERAGVMRRPQTPPARGFGGLRADRVGAGARAGGRLAGALVGALGTACPGSDATKPPGRV